MQKWEYRIVYQDNDQFLLKELDFVGKDGWELVAILPYGRLLSSGYYSFIFKRPLPESESELVEINARTLKM